MKRSESPPLTAEVAAIIKALLAMGRYHQHQIAALLEINQGRVSEVNTGKKFGHVPPARDLPPGFLA